MLDSNIQVMFERSGDSTTDDWSTGYYGSFYQSTIYSQEPYTVGWSFNGEIVEYNVETATENTKIVNRAGKSLKFYIYALGRFSTLIVTQ